MNISMSGVICLSILKTTGDDSWTPLLDLAATVKCIVSMLTDPNPDSPLGKPDFASTLSLTDSPS
jgi:ubiquitin-protein ligase